MKRRTWFGMAFGGLFSFLGLKQAEAKPFDPFTPAAYDGNGKRVARVYRRDPADKKFYEIKIGEVAVGDVVISIGVSESELFKCFGGKVIAVIPPERRTDGNNTGGLDAGGVKFEQGNFDMDQFVPMEQPAYE